MPHSEATSSFSSHIELKPKVVLVTEQEIPSCHDAPVDTVVDDDKVKDWRFYAAFGTMSVITLVASLDATMISVALPTIAADLHGTAVEAFWSGTSFLLTSTVLQPVFASFSHIFGRKPLILTAIFFFALGAAIGGAAQNFPVLLVGRSLQGVGGGGILVLTEIIVTDLIPLRERGKWFGIISMTWAIGSTSGPVLGGAFANNNAWRWIFFINLPICLIGVFGVFFFIRLNFKTTSLLSKLARIDYIGAIVFLGSMTSLLLPVTWGGVEYPWDSYKTIVPLVVGILGLIAFVGYEIYIVAEPLIPMSVFSNRTINLAYFSNFLHGIILYCLLYYVPLYFEAVKEFSPTLTGVALFPFTFTVAPAAVVVGLICTFSGKYRPSIWVGWTITVAGLALLKLLSVTIPTAGWIFVTLPTGLGLGILFPPMMVATQAAAKDGQLAPAVALFSFFRVAGQCFGVAIGGTVFQNAMQSNLSKYPEFAPYASEYAKDASALVVSMAKLPEGIKKETLKIVFTESLKRVFIMLMGVAIVGLLSSLGIKSLDMNRGLSTEQGYKGRPKTADTERPQTSGSLPQSEQWERGTFATS